MAIGVVDSLEMVQIHHQHGGAAAGAPAALHLHVAGFVHVAARQRIGERIVGRQMLQLGAQAVSGHQHQSDRQQQRGKRETRDVDDLVDRRIGDAVLRRGHTESCQPHDLDAGHRQQHHPGQGFGKCHVPLPENQPGMHRKQQRHQGCKTGQPHHIIWRDQREPQRRQQRQCDERHPGPHDGPGTKEKLASDIRQVHARPQQQIGDRDGDGVRQPAAPGNQHTGHKQKQQRGAPLPQTFDGSRVVALLRIQHQRHQAAHDAGQDDDGLGVNAGHGRVHDAIDASTRLRPPFLARYSAASARASRLAVVSAPSS